MIAKDDRCLRIGVLGCGPIAQFAHFDACRKARNAELYAICDLADDLRQRMAAIHQPQVAYADYDAMLADPQVEAVIIAIADQFHVAAALKAIEAGKHVLVEKPLGTTIESCRELRDKAAAAGLVVQVGNNRRFDPGIAFARKFIARGDGRADRAQIVVLRLGVSLHDDRQPPADSDREQQGSASGRRPQGRPPALSTC